MTADMERYEEFAAALEIIDDEDLRFEYIIDIGKKAGDGAFAEEWKTDSNLMHGCMSKVWIVDRMKDGRHYFQGFSDAIIVKGLVTMMVQSFSGLPAEELSALNEDHVRRLNLGALTTQRQVGMLAMLEHMKKLSRIGGNLPADAA
ncbi:MAG: SufE family protein [Rhodospirillaceae bacterium]